VAPSFGIIDSIVRALELGPVVRRGRFTTVHELAPVTVRELARHVQTRLDTGSIRVVGDLERQVVRVGTLIGGLGQMFNAPEEMASLGAEAVIAGECLAYTLWNAEELGMALIEAGHGATENPGMRALAAWLSQRLPAVRVEFIDTGLVWESV
jgi:putative NIF3 family GTP cyclohydrolase 1 type 2